MEVIVVAGFNIGEGQYTKLNVEHLLIVWLLKCCLGHYVSSS